MLVYPLPLSCACARTPFPVFLFDGIVTGRQSPSAPEIPLPHAADVKFGSGSFLIQTPLASNFLPFQTRGGLLPQRPLLFGKPRCLQKSSEAKVLTPPPPHPSDETDERSPAPLRLRVLLLFFFQFSPPLIPSLLPFPFISFSQDFLKGLSPLHENPL